LPYLSSIELGDPDVGVDLLFNIPCNPTYGGLVTVTLTTQSGTPNLPFLLTVSGNSITIQYATDSSGNVRTDEYPTNYNSGVAAAIAANSQAAALVEMLVLYDDVNDQTPFETPLSMGLQTDPGPNSNGQAVYIACGGGSAPANYIYGG
jgi:hypothetical protein